jgi:hypothetical protein
MTLALLPTTQQVKDCFVQEITEAGGKVQDVYDDGSHLFLRSTLPRAWEVRPRDRVQGGVALRTQGRQVLVHPYVYRQVCRNGAIMAQALQTRRVHRVEPAFPGQEDAPEEVLCELSEAVRACCAAEIFETYTEQLRTACEVEADAVLNLAPLLTRMPQGTAAQLMADIMLRFETGRDRSRFGLMNAITSAARDTRDPETRWRLEELGGAVPALRKPVRRAGREALALRA